MEDVHNERAEALPPKPDAVIVLPEDDDKPAEPNGGTPENVEQAPDVPVDSKPAAKGTSHGKLESPCDKVLFSYKGHEITVNYVLAAILGSIIIVSALGVLAAISKKQPAARFTTTVAPTTTVASTTTVAPTTTTLAPTSRPTPPSRLPGYTVVAPNPYPYYYFPVIANESLIFKEAAAECEYYEGYHLAGLDATNLDFLHNTTDLFATISAPAVWMGGYFNLSVQSPANLVFWTDGRVTDSAKAPVGLWCANIADELQRLRATIPATRPAGDVIVPIIRKSGSECLSLHTGDLYLPDEYKTTYPALCTMKTATAFTKDASGETVVPEFYKFPALFNYTNGLAIYDVRNKIDCQYDANCSMTRYGGENEVRCRIAVKTRRRVTLMLSVATSVFIGFPLRVTYDTAAAICSLVRFGNVTKPGQIISYQYLNASTEKLMHTLISDIDIYRESFDDSMGRIMIIDNEGAVSLRLNNNTDNVFFTTAAHFEFTPGASSSSYKELVWKLDSQLVAKKSDTNITYGWCDGSDLHSNLEKLHGEFENWYANQGGNMTTGPYRVHVAINKVPSCIQLIADDLYWPGAKSFIPVCQAPRL